MYLHYNRDAIRIRLMLRGYKLSRFEVHKNGCNLGMFVARMIGKV